MEQIFGQQTQWWWRGKQAAVTDGDGADALAHLALLGSALAGRTIAVRAGAAGQPAWTDGAGVYLDPAATPTEQLQSLAVQASLLAADSLTPAVLRRLGRRGALAGRYLAIEGQRALAGNEELLPRVARTLLDPEVASRSDSPAASLALASASTGIAAPPAVFGIIRAREVLAAQRAAAHAPASWLVPRNDTEPELAELDEAAGDTSGSDPFSSPVGGGGAIGKLLQRMMNRMRRGGSGGPPGADSATHRARSRAGGPGTVISSASNAGAEASPTDRDGVRYPEWDVHQRRYRPDWCTVVEVDPPERRATMLPRPDVHALRRPLTRLGLGLDRARRRPQGDDIDIDAVVQWRADALAGAPTDAAIYVESLRKRRDLAVLVLLDISGSAAEAGTAGRTVHEHQRAAAHALTVALHELGDRVALYAFASQGRGEVRLTPINRFGEAFGELPTRRLAALNTGAYSRLGAAIRHGTTLVSGRGGTSRRLLVVISDGLAYDHGYERDYGAADARRALGEARRDGTGCLCLTVGAGTRTDELRKVFGSAAHASIPNVDHLGEVIGPLFRAALRTADLRRRVS